MLLAHENQLPEDFAKGNMGLKRRKEPSLQGCAPYDTTVDMKGMSSHPGHEKRMFHSPVMARFYSESSDAHY